MSFLKNIMSPFVEFSEEDKKPVPKEGKAAADETTGFVKPKPPVTTPAAVTADNSIPKSVSASEYAKHFEDLIEEANAKNSLFQGTDFKEFIDSKVDVEAISDEATKYKTAFNVLKRTGLTKEKLVTTGNAYINLINADLKGFTDAYTQQYKKDVEQNELLLQAKAAELQQLNEKIAVLSQQIRQVSQDITRSKDQLTSNKDAFVSAGQIKIKDIEAELQKIEQYF